MDLRLRAALSGIRIERRSAGVVMNRAMELNIQSAATAKDVRQTSGMTDGFAKFE